MKISEARQKLRQEFPNKYQSVKYEVITDASGEVTQLVCYLYVGGYGYVEATNFEEAFKLMLAKKQNKNILSDVAEEIES